jgi:long-subunit acyl-CoA synthetase (AMP-forming)
MAVPGFYEELRASVTPSLPVDADLEARRSAILQRLGGRIRYLWTGSAPASPAVLAFFNDCGVPLLEGYGLNETCIVAKNHPGAFRVGSVGKVLPNKSVRFDRDGVLIVGSRTPVNCRYTWCAAGTNERTFLPTGEVKTYDLGWVDEDGFLYIQGRVDDIVTLSSGRNVLVRLVEERLREHPDVAECVLYGTGQEYLSAIISPASAEPDSASLARFVATLNTDLLPEQRVRALVLVTEPFTIDSGLLSSQFKPRRAEIHRRYAEDLAAVYRGSRSATAASTTATLIDVTPVPFPTTSN